MGYRSDIDGLRALSVLAVLVFHIFPEHLHGGFAGVDAFFVISGFLITGLVEKALASGTFSFREFYARRIRRLLPAAQATIALTLLWCALEAPLVLAPVADSAIWSALSAANLHFYSLAGYFDTSAITKPLLHMWSLGVEEQFYLVWPFGLWLVSRLGGKTHRTFTILALLTVALLSFGWSLRVMKSEPNAAFFLPHLRAWEFALGGLLGFVPAPRRFPAAREILWLLGAGLLGGSFFYLKESDPFPGLYGLGPCVGTALLIWSHNPKLLGHLLTNPVSVYLGRISYPVYLVHWPLLVLYTDYIFEKPQPSELFTIFGGSLVLGALLHHLIEEPFRRQTPWARRLTLGRPVLMSALFAGSIVGGAVLLVRYEPELGNTGGARVWKALAESTAHLDEVTSRGRCYVDMHQRYSERRCFRIQPGTANVLLVGDSMAANVYRGFEEYLRGRAHVSLAAGANCRPLLTPTVPSVACTSRNQVVFRTGDISRFDLIIIIGAFNEPDGMDALPEALSTLKRRGAKRVVVVGSPVRYRRDVNEILWHFKDSSFLAVDAALSRFILESRLPAEAQLKGLAQKHGFQYFSTVDLMCTNPQDLASCRHWVDDKSVPIVRDGGHPSVGGARWFAEKLDSQGLFTGF
jgi:peptidoglycan/LPS O-acetylase OafA/YrhL